MPFENIEIRVPSDIKINGLDVDEGEKILNTRFPKEYRQFITKFGVGMICDYIRIYSPNRILNGQNNLNDWRKRIDEYWFWDNDDGKLPKSKALECIIFGDTTSNDELVFHPSNPDEILILPRDFDTSLSNDQGLSNTIEWLCSSGVLLFDTFGERYFEGVKKVKQELSDLGYGWLGYI